MVIAQHGGNGTPELLSGMFGSTHNYNDMLHRILKHGVHIFAPSLMIWSIYAYDAPFDRNAIDAKLKRVGSSITALEVYAIERAMDYYQATDYVKNFGMCGLSYGGFYTLQTAAADTRIRSAISDAYFNERDRYPWPDWVFPSSAYLYDDAEIACLCYPRRLSQRRKRPRRASGLQPTCARRYMETSGSSETHLAIPRAAKVHFPCLSQKVLPSVRLSLRPSQTAHLILKDTLHAETMKPHFRSRETSGLKFRSMLMW